jgi:hypothetical protein
VPEKRSHEKRIYEKRSLKRIKESNFKRIKESGRKDF